MAKKFLVFCWTSLLAMSGRKMRKRGWTSAQTTETVHQTRGHTAGKKRKEDDPLTALDVPQIVQAIVDSLHNYSSCTEGGGDNGITGVPVWITNKQWSSHKQLVSLLFGSIPVTIATLPNIIKYDHTYEITHHYQASVVAKSLLVCPYRGLFLRPDRHVYIDIHCRHLQC